MLNRAVGEVAEGGAGGTPDGDAMAGVALGDGDGEEDEGEEARRARSRELRERYPNVKSARTDDEFNALVRRRKEERDEDGRDDLVVVDFGAVWCEHCRGMLPAFLGLADAYPGHTFVVADVDRLPIAADAIRYTPTFSFYRRGRKVDEFFGGTEQKLQDRVWLHSQAVDARLQGEVDRLRSMAARARARAGGAADGEDQAPSRAPRAPFARPPLRADDP